MGFWFSGRDVSMNFVIRPESRTFGRNNPSYSRGYRGLTDLVGANTDWDRSGGGGYGGGGCCCGGGGGGGGVGLGNLISEGTLLALLAAAALAFYILYTAVTAAAAAAGGRRKRRNTRGDSETEEIYIEDILFKGRLSILLLCHLNNWIGLSSMVYIMLDSCPSSFTQFTQRLETMTAAPTETNEDKLRTLSNRHKSSNWEDNYI